MAQYEVDYQMSFSDLWTFLFRRKVCPKCGAKLIRHMERQESGPKWQREGSWFDFRIWYGNRISETVLYRCERCAVTYTLTQLRRGLPGVPMSETKE